MSVPQIRVTRDMFCGFISDFLFLILNESTALFLKSKPATLPVDKCSKMWYGDGFGLMRFTISQQECRDKRAPAGTVPRDGSHGEKETGPVESSQSQRGPTRAFLISHPSFLIFTDFPYDRKNTP